MKQNQHPSILKLASSIEATAWHEKRVYGAFLAQTYYYVSHSTRILSLAASRFPMENEELHQRFLAHAREESKHEILALKDLKGLGLSLDDFPQFMSTQAFYKCQYYNIEHISPCSLFGWILSLEGLAVEKGLWLYKTVKELYGARACSFIRVHAEEDPNHLQQALGAVKAMSGDEREQIFANLTFSCNLYQLMLKECSDYAHSISAMPATA